MTQRPSPVAALTAFLIAAGGLLLYESVFAFLRGLDLTFGMTPAYVMSIAFQGAAFAAPVMLYYRSAPRMTPALRLQRLDPLCAFVIILGALVGVLALNWISTYWMLLLQSFGLTVSTGNSAAPRTPQQLALMLMAVAVAPALCEELLFRGFLLPSMEPLGKRWAVVISGVMFAMLHGRLEALPAHLLLGCMLAILVIRTDSIFSAILYHGVYNSAIMLMAYVTARADPASLEKMATVAESIQALPMAVFLLLLWVSLLLMAFWHGAKVARTPLPAAEPRPLSVKAKALMAVSGALLLLQEVRALLGMLPGRGL